VALAVARAGLVRVLPAVLLVAAVVIGGTTLGTAALAAPPARALALADGGPGACSACDFRPDAPPPWAQQGQGGMVSSESGDSNSVEVAGAEDGVVTAGTRDPAAPLLHIAVASACGPAHAALRAAARASWVPEASAHGYGVTFFVNNDALACEAGEVGAERDTYGDVAVLYTR
jgi:hypothetical protein